VVQKTIEDLNEKYDLQFVAVDRWNASQLIQDLNEKIDKRFVNSKWEDFIHEYGQGYKDMSTPAKEYEMIYIEENICHDGNPVHAWMLGNVAISTDAAGNIKPDKAKSSNKIDGVVSDVMAYGTYLTFYTEDNLNPTCY